MNDGAVCGCCNDGVQETIEHLFIRCSFSKSIWTYFSRNIGSRYTMYKWWNVDAFAKLKPVMMVFVRKCGKEEMP